MVTTATLPTKTSALDPELLAIAVDGGRAPLLTAAIDGLFDLLRSADLDPRHILGARNPTGLLERHRTLGDWLVQGIVRDDEIAHASHLGRWSHAAARHGGGPDWLDRWLVPELILGLARFPHAQRIHGPARDNWMAAIAALAAVDAYRPLIDASLTPEELLTGPGCHLRPAIAHALPAGRFLAASIGMESLLAAATGAAPFDDAIDHLQVEETEALLGLAHAPHATSAAQPFGEQDAAWIEDVVLAMVHRRRSEAGNVRAHLVVPSGGGLTFDLRAAQLRTLGPASRLSEHVSEGWVDAEIAHLPLPAGPCAGLVARGLQRIDLKVEHLDAVDDLFDALFEVFAGEADGEELHGEGFILHFM